MSMVIVILLIKYVILNHELNEFVERYNSIAQQKSLKDILDH